MGKIEYADYGSCTGYIRRLSNRRGNEATIYEDLWNKPVACFGMSVRLLDKIDKAFWLKRRCDVYGVISYSKDGKEISIKVEDVVLHPHPKDIPSMSSLAGILKNHG